MNKIKAAHKLVDKILDECDCSYDSTKEMDQQDVAFQPDTLFDNPERIVKDKTDDDPSLNPVPNTENLMIKNLNLKFSKHVQEDDGSINASKVAAEMNKQQSTPVTAKVNTDQQTSSDIKEGLTDWAQGLIKTQQKKFVKGNEEGGPVAKNRAALKKAMEG